MRPGYVDVEGLMYVPDEAYFWIQKYRIYRDDIYISVAGTLGIVGQIPGYLDGAKDLLNRLNVYDDSLICSLVHKFGRRGGEATENDYDKYIEELKASLPANFEAKEILWCLLTNATEHSLVSFIRR